MGKKLLFLSLGSRGDMEPFLALGEELKQQGHTVAFCFPASFKPLASEVSEYFYPQDNRFLEWLEHPDVVQLMSQSGNFWKRMKTLMSLTQKIKPIQEQLLLDQEKAVQDFQPDEIIFHIKCVYPIFWKFFHGGTITLLSPMPGILDPIDEEPHTGFGSPGPKWWNRFTYWLGETAIIHKSILGYGASYLKKHQLRLNARDLRMYLRNELPIEYAISETLFPRPAYWPSRAKITRFRERNKAKHYPGNPELDDFLNRNPNPMYIGFGSMINAYPEQIGRDLIAISQKHKIPMVINRSWGGIILPENLPPHIFAVKDIPYDDLFPKVRAVIHHGGSGTTHSAFICGKPQASIPHIGDQFFWSRTMVKNGYGVPGFPIKEWNQKRAEALILKLWNREF
jgi:sterol 3beta-glucosyltransferase